jgi:magnesium transporter
VRPRGKPPASGPPLPIGKDEDTPLEPILARWDGSPELAGRGVGFLVWGLLDVIVDDHFTAVQSLDTAIEELEDLLFDDAQRGTEVQRRSFELRKSLVMLRRVVLPMRDLVNSLMRRDLGVVDATMAPYFQDVYDHVLRATEWTESLRDLVTTIRETYLTIQGNRMNLVMKKVTSSAAIIAVPTAITGFYGQNIPFPGFGVHWGFWDLEWADRRRLAGALPGLPPLGLAVARESARGASGPRGREETLGAPLPPAP